MSMKIETWIARCGITNALFFARSRMDRAQSHVALDRLHALVAEILQIERCRDESVVALLDACDAYDQHDSVSLHWLATSVFDAAPLGGESACTRHKIVGCLCQVIE